MLFFSRTDVEFPMKYYFPYNVEYLACRAAEKRDVDLRNMYAMTPCAGDEMVSLASARYGYGPVCARDNSSATYIEFREATTTFGLSKIDLCTCTSRILIAATYSRAKSSNFEESALLVCVFWIREKTDFKVEGHLDRVGRVFFHIAAHRASYSLFLLLLGGLFCFSAAAVRNGMVCTGEKESAALACRVGYEVNLVTGVARRTSHSSTR